MCTTLSKVLLTYLQNDSVEGVQPKALILGCSLITILIAVTI